MIDILPLIVVTILSIELIGILYCIVRLLILRIKEKPIQISLKKFFIKKRSNKTINVIKHDELNLPLIDFDDKDEYGDWLTNEIEESLFAIISKELYYCKYPDKLTKKEIIELYTNKDSDLSFLNWLSFTEHDLYIIDYIRYHKFNEKRGSYKDFK